MEGFQEGDDEALRRLIQNPSFDVNKALCLACVVKKLWAVKMLLGDPMIDPNEHRAVFEICHPVLLQEYDARISQCYATGFVAKQHPTWESLAEPLADRLKVSF